VGRRGWKMRGQGGEGIKVVGGVDGEGDDDVKPSKANSIAKFYIQVR
jgi:hypothetical protein